MNKLTKKIAMMVNDMFIAIFGLALLESLETIKYESKVVKVANKSANGRALASVLTV
jgi:hypothetical protein